jgi:hypothetical protein
LITSQGWIVSSAHPREDSFVEVKVSPFTGHVMVRHSTDGGWAISVPIETWRKFIAGVKVGDFDL